VATLREAHSNLTATLEHEHVVGRSPLCALRLEDPHASAQHAVLRWSGQHWEVRDLGSRNGTFLDGEQVQPGRDYRLVTGSTLCFGDLGRPWTLEDEEPPQVMVVPVDGGPALLGDGNLLGIPSPQDPAATVFRGTDGQWRLERGDDSTRILANHQQFEVGGQLWRFSCPEAVSGTTSLNGMGPEVRLLALQFAVTPDEEHVELRARWGPTTYDLGSRGHNYLLLTLARHRVEDAAQAQPDPLCGWVYQDELIDGLGISPSQLNIDIFRIRKQFAAAGIIDAAGIIERRPGTKQLRIGASKLEIRVG
jgi:hypothetical protein